VAGATARRGRGEPGAEVRDEEDDYAE